MYGDSNYCIPGSEVVAHPSKQQFRSLEEFSKPFLYQSFYCSTMPSPVLQRISIVNVHGLPSKKSEHKMSAEYFRLVEWFAERVDNIFLLYEANNPSEFEDMVKHTSVLRNYEKKISFILAKVGILLYDIKSNTCIYCKDCVLIMQLVC